MEDPRDKVLQHYCKKGLEGQETDCHLKELGESLELTKQYEKPDKDLKTLQSAGQIVGEMLQQLTEQLIVKATRGPAYAVGCHRQLDRSKLKPGTRVVFNVTALPIMRYLPREIKFTACLVRILEMFLILRLKGCQNRIGNQ